MWAFEHLFLLLSLASGNTSQGYRRQRLCTALDGGAVGGGADDTVALQHVLDDSSCSEIVFPANTVLHASALHVRRSNVVLTLERNATLAGLPRIFRASRPDCATEARMRGGGVQAAALLVYV